MAAAAGKIIPLDSAAAMDRHAAGEQQTLSGTVKDTFYCAKQFMASAHHSISGKQHKLCVGLIDIWCGDFRPLGWCCPASPHLLLTLALASAHLQQRQGETLEFSARHSVWPTRAMIAL